MHRALADEEPKGKSSVKDKNRKRKQEVKNKSKTADRMERERRAVAMTVVDDVILLRTKGYLMADIEDMTLHQFVLTVKAVRRNIIQDRKSFIADLAASISGVLGGDTLEEHIDELEKAKLREL